MPALQLNVILTSAYLLTRLFGTLTGRCVLVETQFASHSYSQLTTLAKPVDTIEERSKEETRGTSFAPSSSSSGLAVHRRAVGEIGVTRRATPGLEESFHEGERPLSRVPLLFWPSAVYRDPAQSPCPTAATASSVRLASLAIPDEVPLRVGPGLPACLRFLTLLCSALLSRPSWHELLLRPLARRVAATSPPPFVTREKR